MSEEKINLIHHLQVVLGIEISNHQKHEIFSYYWDFGNRRCEHLKWVTDDLLRQDRERRRGWNK